MLQRVIQVKGCFVYPKSCIFTLRICTMDQIKKLLHDIQAVAHRYGLSNRYVFTLCVFFIWIAFFDRSSVITQVQLSQTIDRLEEEKVFYQEKIAEAKVDRVDIEVNKEKYARERYFMHMPDEEVFIIER